MLKLDITRDDYKDINWLFKKITKIYEEVIHETK